MHLPMDYFCFECGNRDMSIHPVTFMLIKGKLFLALISG